MRWTKDLMLVPDSGRAGLPHPAHLQERKLSTSKPRYKGGEKVYHCGGGIVYHPHDEKELNWEPYKRTLYY